MKVPLMMFFNQSILQLYQAYKKSLGRGSGWIIDSVIDLTISISNDNLLNGCSYIELPKELNHPRKGLINIQNIDDNECFKWCLVRYLNLADCKSARITQADKDLVKKLDSEDIKLPVKVSDIYKIEKKGILSALVFLVMK